MIYRPRYNGYSLYNLSQSIIQYFGGVPDGKTLDIKMPIDDGLVIFLFDALGLSILENLGAKNEHEEITSVFPSTTATALTTFFTGKKPCDHGVLGFLTFVREMGGVVNMLGLSHPSGPQLPTSYEKLVGPGERLGKKLSKLGVTSISILPKSVSNTPMSNFDNEGFSAVIPYYDFWDLRLLVEKQLSKPERKFIYVYVPYVDTLSHHYGPYSQETASAVKDLLNFFEQVSQAPGYTIVGTADHGQVEVDPAQPPPPELMSLLEVPPFGDSRAMFLKTRRTHDVIDYLNRDYPDFYVMTKEQVLSEGLIGCNSTEFEERLGDLLVLPQHKRLLIYPYTENNESMNFRGHHGGLSPEEMRVPLLIRSKR
ncbi:MAG: alkaline phosphatase family protein [Thermoprotei archaeon]